MHRQPQQNISHDSGSQPSDARTLISGRLRSQRAHACAVLLLATHAVLLAWLGYRYSPTLDEVGHLPAGVCIWKFGRFDLYRVNPPLVKSVAAIPVLAGGMEQDWSHFGDTTTHRPEWSIGGDFIRANGEHSWWWWTLARWACIPFSLVGGVVCYLWSRELFGSLSGLGALALWCFSPNILAYGAQILPDLTATSTGVLAVWMFRQWLRKKNRIAAIWAGFALGLAELSKLTWIILFPLLPVIWCVLRLAAWRDPGRRERPPAAVQLAAVLAIGLYALNLGYAFDGSLTILGDYEFYSQLLSGTEIHEPGNRFRGTPLEYVPVPLPRDYVTGVDLQKLDFEEGNWSFLAGEYRESGWWYFYIYTLAIKEPLGTWLLFACGLASFAIIRAPRLKPADVLCLVVPPLVLFCVVSQETGFSRYMRYALPVLPFVYVIASRVFALNWKPALTAGTALLLWSVGSSLWCFPHSYSYANELIGGPLNGRFHTYAGNFDWGQDVRELRQWVDDHPEARPLTINVETFYDLKVAGLDFPRTPPCRGGEIPNGWHVLSVSRLQDHTGQYDCYEALTPVDRVGYSMLVYHVR